MSQLIECPVDGATSLSSENDTSESDDPAMKAPLTKKAKGMSKVLGLCLGKSLSAVLTPHQQVK